MKNLAEKISASELEVMQVLWEAGDALPLTDIRRTLQSRFDWSDPTVKTLVRRLCEKGAVKQEKLFRDLSSGKTDASGMPRSTRYLRMASASGMGSSLPCPPEGMNTALLPQASFCCRKNSSALSTRPFSRGGSVLFVTTSYHVFRSGICAARAGLAAEGTGEKTAWWYWPNAFLREVAGLLAKRWKQELALLALLIVFFGAMSMLL